MLRTLKIAILALSALVPSMAGASPLTAKFTETVQPDPELTTFLRSLVDIAQMGIRTKADVYAVLDKLIAPDVRGFTRGLDPFEQWSEVEISAPEREAGVDLLTAWMVEQGDIPEGVSALPDYREDLLELIVTLIANPAKPLGRMPEMGNAVCSPARYEFDTRQALEFAQANNTDGYGIVFFSRQLDLHAAPDAETPVSLQLEQRTLLVTEYQSGQSENWVKVLASDGITGWAEHQADYEGLSQQHLCFRKVDGQYKIVGFYSYGL